MRVRIHSKCMHNALKERMQQAFSWLDLQKSGFLARKPGSGRKRHPNFATPAKERESLHLVEDLDKGEHLADAATKLNCSTATIKNYAKKNGARFLMSPKEDVNARQPEIERKRKNFARAHLRSRDRLSSTLGNATTLDHKWMHLYSENRRHSMQFRLPGSEKPLRPQLKSTNNPKVHAMFAANKNGTEVLFHAKK